MLPDDDKRYAIETCRSSESAFVGGVMISESTRCTVQQ